MTAVHRLLDRVVCRYSTHDWWALAYPPARRWECRRCGLIAEEAPSSLPERRRVRPRPDEERQRSQSQLTGASDTVSLVAEGPGTLSPCP